MKNILFIGAGGFASECYMYLKEIMQDDKTINFKGFLSTSNDLEQYGLSDLFIGHYDNYNFQENDYILIAIGEPTIRKKLYYYFKEKGVKFYTLISKHALVSTPENIGEGSIVANLCTIATNAKIGKCNVINALSGIGHDAVIGDFNVFSSHLDICGYTQIGDCNFFGSRCSTLPKSKIGNNNKISAGSIIFKRAKDNGLYQGNPAVRICNIEEI